MFHKHFFFLIFVISKFFPFQNFNFFRYLFYYFVLFRLYNVQVLVVFLYVCVILIFFENDKMRALCYQFFLFLVFSWFKELFFIFTIRILRTYIRTWMSIWEIEFSCFCDLYWLNLIYFYCFDIIQFNTI